MIAMLRLKKFSCISKYPIYSASEEFIYSLEFDDFGARKIK